MAVNRKGLGRGLDALLGDYGAEPPEGVIQADIYLIDTNADQPRKTFDEERLRELASSIERHGMVQPIIVRRNGERYTIVAGERRYRAARLAGMARVPVIVKDFDEAEVHEVALVENLQRENLNPMEEAAAIRFLMQQHDLTQEEVSQRLGKSRPVIANSLRLLNLPEDVQKFVRDGELSSGHARAIAGLKDEGKQKSIASDAVKFGWSVRDVENKTASINNAALYPHAPKDEKEPKRPKQNADMYSAQENLREKLGTKVTIEGTEKRGKITLEYYTRESLEWLYELLMQG
ncbi:MAG TPA: ParB/RepB/Spo0J family partition protein, partial [Clostridia bacterium]|nr:ParB/RepB/Spo0J family partition protein [Clostridia bacterium]